MYDISKFSDEERRTIFRNTAQKMGVHEAIIEKDYWVCLVLRYLFHKSRYQGHLTFKGGTSLSKCFDLISRFSEDLDLIIDWQLLGFEKGEPWEDRSKTKQDFFNKEANAKAGRFLADEFLPTFIADLSEIIGEKVRADIAQSDPQTVIFHYPQIFSTESIVQSIRLEMGALAAWTPSVRRTVAPYIFAHYPQLAWTAPATVLTTSAERTFWEKATILHHEANRPEHLAMPRRYSRHYYDLFCISQTDYKSDALRQIGLLRKVVAFKMRFYPRAWAKYEESVPGTMRLVPPHFRHDALRRDYEEMSEMLFGDYPGFDKLMDSMAILEREINQL